MLNSISDLIYSQKIELKKLWKNKRTLLLQVRQDMHDTSAAYDFNTLVLNANPCPDHRVNWTLGSQPGNDRLQRAHDLEGAYVRH